MTAVESSKMGEKLDYLRRAGSKHLQESNRKPSALTAPETSQALLLAGPDSKINGNYSSMRTSSFPLLQMLISWPSHGAICLCPLREQERLHPQWFHHPLHSVWGSYPPCQQHADLLPCSNIFSLGKLSRRHQLHIYLFLQEMGLSSVDNI